MRFRPANIRLINRRSNMLRLLLALFSRNSKSNRNDKNNPTDSQGWTGSLHIRDLSSTETGTVHSAEHRKDGDPTTLARFLLGRVNRIEYKLLMVRQAVHPPYRYWIETARLRWIARGECPNARRNDRRMRSRFPKPFFLAISSAEKRPVSIIKRADSTRSCWIA
jgi:hypothetical protein